MLVTGHKIQRRAQSWGLQEGSVPPVPVSHRDHRVRTFASGSAASENVTGTGGDEEKRTTRGFGSSEVRTLDDAVRKCVSLQG